MNVSLKKGQQATLFLKDIFLFNSLDYENNLGPDDEVLSLDPLDCDLSVINIA